MEGINLLLYSNQFPYLLIVKVVRAMHSESARVWKNYSPSDTLLSVSKMCSELKHRLLVMARAANSNNLLRVVSVTLVPKP